MIPVTLDFFIETCCTCGIPFGVSKDFNEECRRMGKSFFCPNGHTQSYGKSAADIVREEKAVLERRLQAELNEARHLQLVAEKERDSAIRKSRKIERRIAKGVCPCCNRTFEDIARHMATKHKDFALPPGKPKAIEGTVQ